MGVPEGEERKNGTERLSEEIMDEKFPNMRKEMNIQIQDAQRTPNRMDLKRTTLRHTIKLKIQKQRILKPAREKLIHHKHGTKHTVMRFKSRNIVG